MYYESRAVISLFSMMVVDTFGRKMKFIAETFLFAFYLWKFAFTKQGKYYYSQVKTVSQVKHWVGFLFFVFWFYLLIPWMCATQFLFLKYVVIAAVYNTLNNLSFIYYVSYLHFCDSVFPSSAVYGQSFYHDRANMKTPKYTYMDNI